MFRWSRQNSGFRWILTCIDITSRFAWAVPLYRKTGPHTAQAFRIILCDGVPKRVTSDNGGEFMNRSFRELMEEHGIRHYQNQPGDHSTMGLIERFHRTLRDLPEILPVFRGIDG